MIGRKITSGKRIGAFLAAAALVVGMALSPLMAGQAYALNMDGPYTLTVKPYGDSVEEDPSLNVTADIYKVADAVKDPMYETIHFTAGSDYADVDVDGKTFQEVLSAEKDLTKDVWKNLGIKAGLTALDGGLTPVDSKVIKSSDGADVSAFDIKKPGLYLVIAHGTGENPADYIVKDGDDPAEPLVTTATSDDWIYSWVPQLVAVPSPSSVETPDPEEPVMTSDGDWIDDITITLKPSLKPANGTFKIVKDLLRWESRTETSAVFVIEATKNGETVYSNTVTMFFDEPGVQTWPDDFMDEEDYPELPSGAEVTVTEEYAGANYKLVSQSYGYVDANGDEIEDKEFDAPLIEHEDTLQYTFVNDYEGGDKGSGGVENRYQVLINSDGSHSIQNFKKVYDDGREEDI